MIFHQKNNFLLIYLPVLLSILSCTKEVEIKIPKEEPKLTVNSFFSPDSVIKIHLSKSAYIFDEKTTIINNANIELWNEDTLLEIMQYENDGIYFSKTKPKVSKKYQIKINYPDFQLVTAEDVIPAKTKIIETEQKDSVMFDLQDMPFSQVNITFQDNPNITNYYEVILAFEHNDSITSKFMTLDRIYSDDPAIKSEIDTDINSIGEKSLVFSDNLFNGEKYTLTLLYSLVFIPDDLYQPYLPPRTYKNYTLYVYLYSVSKNYYNYMKKLRQYIKNSYNLWNNPGEVIRMYSNVNNGYGIFAGYNTDIDTLYVN